MEEGDDLSSKEIELTEAETKKLTQIFQRRLQIAMVMAVFAIMIAATYQTLQKENKNLSQLRLIDVVRFAHEHQYDNLVLGIGLGTAFPLIEKHFTLFILVFYALSNTSLAPSFKKMLMSYSD
ncbi:MAG TPA: hypothetical protein VLH77_00845, partial [Gammaproteobacteria bacterium]|nr:hypothetical protein [Gammaproteobacteria bacterium]